MLGGWARRAERGFTITEVKLHIYQIMAHITCIYYISWGIKLSKGPRLNYQSQTTPQNREVRFVFCMQVPQNTLCFLCNDNLWTI